MNFRHITTVVPAALSHELSSTPIWNWLNLRKFKGSEHTGVSDIVLRFNSIEGQHEPKEYFDGVECVDFFVQRFFPKTMLLAKTFAGNQQLGRVLYAKLRAGQSIGNHIDEGQYAAEHDRHHVVLSTNPQTTFTCDGEVQHMQAGEIWWFDNKKTHRVDNLGQTDRVHLIIDIKKDSK